MIIVICMLIGWILYILITDMQAKEFTRKSRERCYGKNMDVRVSHTLEENTEKARQSIRKMVYIDNEIAKGNYEPLYRDMLESGMITEEEYRKKFQEPIIKEIKRKEIDSLYDRISQCNELNQQNPGK